MKTFIILSFISLSSFAACPDLSGHYPVCRSKENILIEGVLSVKKIEVPGNTFYKMDLTPDGSSEVEEVFFPANGVPVKDSWVGSTGMKYERTTSARCLADNLLQVRTEILRDDGPHVLETSQYFKQGDALVRISRGQLVELKYRDILTCN